MKSNNKTMAKLKAYKAVKAKPGVMPKNVQKAAQRLLQPKSRHYKSQAALGKAMGLGIE